MRRRARLAFGAFLISVAVATLGSAGIANGLPVSNLPEEECNDEGRIFCIDVTTFQNITASDPDSDDGDRYTWVEWQMRNGPVETATLTHPTITVSLTDYCGVSVCASLTSAFVGSDSSNACSPSGPSGSSLECTYPNIPAGGNTGAPTRIFFKTADLPATRTVISLEGLVKERRNDANPCEVGDPNCDTFSTSVTNSYEGEPFNAYTFALTGNRFHLDSNDELYSLGFTSTSPPTPLTVSQFQALAPSTTFCFGSIPCFDRTLFADTSGASRFVFYARLLDPPGGVTAKNLAAIHTYDAITLEADATSDRFTAPDGTSFARLDGVSFDASAPPSAVIEAGKYFVVNYQAADESFQVSLTKGGAPVPLGNGSVPGQPIRIIGDQSDERSNEGCTTMFSNLIPFPSICAQKVPGQPRALDAWVWDSGNGQIQY